MRGLVFTVLIGGACAVSAWAAKPVPTPSPSAMSVPSPAPPLVPGEKIGEIKVRARPLTKEIAQQVQEFKSLRKEYRFTCPENPRSKNPVSGKWAQKAQESVDQNLNRIQKQVEALHDQLRNPPDRELQKVQIQVQAVRERYRSEVGMLQYLSYRPYLDQYEAQRRKVAQTRQEKEIVEKKFKELQNPKRAERVKDLETRRMLQEMEQLVKLSERYVRFGSELRGCEAHHFGLGKPAASDPNVPTYTEVGGRAASEPAAPSVAPAVAPVMPAVPPAPPTTGAAPSTLPVPAPSR